MPFKCLAPHLQPFWASVSCTACFDSPTESGAELLHEAWYILSITPVTIPEKGRSPDTLSFVDSNYLPMDLDRRDRWHGKAEASDASDADEENMDGGVPHARALQEAVIHHLDIPLIAMSK